MSAAGSGPEGLRTVADFELEAATRLSEPVMAYVASWADQGVAVATNRRAYDRLRIVPSVLVDVSDPTTATTVLGAPVDLPVLVAPTAGHDLVHEEGELATARAAASAGTVMCVSLSASRSLHELADAAPSGRRWLQLFPYADRQVTRALTSAAADAGCEAVVVTVDAPVRGRRTATHVPRSQLRLLQAILGTRASDYVSAGAVALDPSASWQRLEQIVEDSPIPVIPKGILAAADVERACALDVPAIIISNHGGRQLDQAPATLEVLPAAVAAARGRAELLIDGGVRRGSDIVKALALGARATLIGRPVLHALAVDGEHGLTSLLKTLEAELLNTMMLSGCRTPIDCAAVELAATP